MSSLAPNALPGQSQAGRRIGTPYSSEITLLAQNIDPSAALPLLPTSSGKCTADVEST